MKLATSTADFRSYSDDISSQVSFFKGTGFKYLDLSLYSMMSELSTDKDAAVKRVAEAVETADKLGMKFVQAHAPDGEHFVPGQKRDDLIRATKASIECCAVAGIKNLVAHPAPMRDVSYAEFLQNNLAFYRECFPTMEKFGVNLLVENGPEQHAPFSFIFSNGHDIKHFLEYANHPLLHAVWDTGHANMRQMDQYDSIVTLGDELYALHIADNAGDRDSHTAPFFGNCNFDAIMQALIDIGYKGYFTFEAGNIIVNAGSWPCTRVGWEHNGQTVTKLLEVPFSLKHSAVTLMHDVGKYILEQYNVYDPE